MASNDLASWIPQTKLTPPRLRGDLVPRPRLLERLQHAVMDAALTLIAAPAGYGKTTLLAYAQALSPQPVIWFALDEHDNDPSLFLSGLVAAIRQRYPGYGQRAEALLAQPTLAAEQVAGALINDLLVVLDVPTVLIIDDLHLVRDPAIYALLGYLVERMPALLRLVAATRHDPPLALARWRARGLLAELRLGELSFRADETAELLNGQLRLNLSGADLATFQQSTEGWVAGLRLLAGSFEGLPGQAGRPDLLQHLARGNRAVAEVLLEEVLNRQELALRSFLLATSILDELTPALCEAVSGRPDAAELLETLYRRNLFLIALPGATPDAAPSYRYHALFSGFLRQQLAREADPEEVMALHHVAADAEPAPTRAIAHYLAARAWEKAIGRIEREGGLLVRRGLRRIVQGWIAAMPAGTAEARPRLCYLLGVCAWHQADPGDAYTWLMRAADGFAAAGDLAGQGEALGDLGIPLMWMGQLAQGEAIIHQALELPLPPRSRLHATLNLFAASVLRRRQHEPSRATLEALMDLARTIDDPQALTNVLVASTPQAATLLDSLDVMKEFFDQALPPIQQEISSARAAALSAQAAIVFIKGQLDAALRLGQLSQTVSAQAGGYPYVEVPLAIMLAQAYIAVGSYDDAERQLQLGLDELQRLPLADLELAAYLYVRGRLCWLRGDSAGMGQAYARMQAAARDDELSVAPLARGLMGGLLMIAAGQHGEARQILADVAAREEQSGLLVIYGSARPLLAHLALLRGRPAEALAALEPWLADCARYDTPGRILLEGAYVIPLLRLAAEHNLHADLAARALALFPASPGGDTPPQPLRVPETGETLTAREVEVLRLLAQGATNKAIAERLIIGEQTVKTHVARILAKLGAATRTEAATRAYTLGIVG